MSSKQTRKSVSIRGITYRHVKRHCDAQGITMSAFFETLAADRLGPPPNKDLQEVDADDEVRQSDGHASPQLVEDLPSPESELRSSIEVEVEVEADTESEYTREPEPPKQRPQAGVPIPETLKPRAPKDQPEALSGYVPPILEF